MSEPKFNLIYTVRESIPLAELNKMVDLSHPDYDVVDAYNAIDRIFEGRFDIRPYPTDETFKDIPEAMIPSAIFYKLTDGVLKVFASKPNPAGVTSSDMKYVLSTPINLFNTSPSEEDDLDVSVVRSALGAIINSFDLNLEVLPPVTCMRDSQFVFMIHTHPDQEEIQIGEEMSLHAIEYVGNEDFFVGDCAAILKTISLAGKL